MMLIVMKRMENGKCRLDHISSTLIRLMHGARIKTISDLSDQAGIPYSCLEEIISCEIDSSQEANMLNKLATFFGLSVEQLIGKTPIPADWAFGYNNLERKAWTVVPVIEWGDAITWVFDHDAKVSVSCKSWINTGEDLSKKSFALKSKSFMEPRFREGSLIIVDPESLYRDGDYIIVAIDDSPTVRKITEEGRVFVLKALNKKITSDIFDKIHRYLGKIVECRL